MMDRFARIVLGYHGCREPEAQSFARKLLLGEAGVEDWRPSENEWDWLGKGIYFWEHSPERAFEWSAGGLVIGAVIQLGHCLDLTDRRFTEMLAQAFTSLAESYKEQQLPLPDNKGREKKNRALDRLVINHLVDLLASTSLQIQTVRGAFEEGDEAFPGSLLKKQTHIQIAVRDPTCILGVFRPTAVASERDMQ